MANYIITDNGQGEIAVYDDVVEKTAARTYHVYKDIDRRNYPYAEFFKRVFYEDKNNTISSISIDTNPKNNDQMCYIFEANHNSKTSTFNISDYNKVEIKRFYHGIDENNNPTYEEYSDVYDIRKRTNERLMSGIKIRAKNISSQKEARDTKINTIKRNIQRKRKISQTTDKIIENYFENDGAFTDDVLGIITSREMSKEISEHRDKIVEDVSRKWDVTDNIRRISNTATATGLVGGGLATALSSFKAEHLTMGPIILGIGTVFITHHLLKSVRMTLVDSKIGKMEKEYLRANYDMLTRHRSK